MDWFRMYGEFATDPKVQMMSEADQRRFVMLLCLRCSNDGVTLHETEIAFQMRITDEQWVATKALFLAKGLIDEECRITAWDKRQFTSDSSKSRVAKHREKKKQARNVTVTPPDTDTDTDIEEHTHNACAHDESSAEDHATRPRFPMTDVWEPDPKTFTAVLHRNAMANQTFLPDQLLEFRSYWISRPDDVKTQAQWEHTLAQQLKRQHVTNQSRGNGHDSSGRTDPKRTRNAHDILNDPNW